VKVNFLRCIILAVSGRLNKGPTVLQKAKEKNKSFYPSNAKKKKTITKTLPKTANSYNLDNSKSPQSKLSKRAKVDPHENVEIIQKDSFANVVGIQKVRLLVDK
jgi:hypothetical protein